MKKRRIVLASILKPVDDTRMCEKIGKTLSRNPGYEIFIIGYPSKNVIHDPQITFLPIDTFSRLSLKRLLTRLKILKKTIQVKPDILIVNSHELLIVGVVNRILFGAKIIYDIQENYWRNILWTDAFPFLLRPVIAFGVRLKEKLFSPFFHVFFLAEKGYEKELSFIKKRYLVLENKSQLPEHFTRHNVPGKIQLLFTGTLSKSTGVLEAIRLTDALHQADKTIQLKVVGYCARESELTEIRNAIEGKNYITLIGGNTLVPHPEIIDQIASADFGIICYPSSPHTENKIPTKLYEYLHARLPILLQNHPPWVQLCEHSHAAIVVDFHSIDVGPLIKKMKDLKFYTASPGEVEWSGEAQKLVQAISKILT